MKPPRPALALIALGLFLGWLAGELFLQRAGHFQVWRGGMQVEFVPQPGLMLGVEGPARFQTDAWGIRGTAYADIPPGSYRLLAIGGSTTECLFLDEGEAWPALLEQQSGGALWVGNVGRSGHRSLDHWALLMDFVPRLDLDGLLILAGVNDLLALLSQPGRPPSDFGLPPQGQWGRGDVRRLASFDHRPYRLMPWRASPLITVDLLRHHLLKRLFPPAEFKLQGRIEAAGAHYTRWRAAWLAAPLLPYTSPDELPNFAAALAIYADNLRAITQAAQEQGLTLVWLTQPSVWSNELDPAFEAYLWMGFQGPLETPQARYQPGLLAQAMTRYNAVMRQVCAETGAHCIDLATALGPDPTYFYDDVHLNEAGARRVAEILWLGLQSPAGGLVLED
jgi:lysophospholipase L1-like esterase